MKELRDRRRKPSKGIVIFSVILILFGAINFLSILISFFQLRLELQIKDHIPGLFAQFPNISINYTLFWLSTILSMIIMLAWIISGIGLLILKEWARQLLLVSIGVYFINKTLDVIISISIIQEHTEQIPIVQLVAGILFVLVFSISVINFFTHPSIIRQFRRDYRTFH